MRQPSLTPLTWALALSLSTACCGGLSDQFFIVQNQVPQKGCVIPADRGAIYRGSGYLDVAFVAKEALDAYILFPLLQNDLPARGQAGATEPNRLALREFRVRLEPGRGAPAELVNLFSTAELAPYLTYSVPTSGSVDPAGGNTSSSVTVVPAEVARRIDALGILETLAELPLIARVRAVGDTLVDTVESREFDYPISVCKYCFITAIEGCAQNPTISSTSCNIAQDYSLTCPS